MQNKKLSIGTTAMLVILAATQLATCMHATAQTEKVLHSFSGIDGNGPAGGLVIDDSGNLYGTTQTGGTHQGGTVFKLTPTVGGEWTETVLHDFPQYSEPEQPNLSASLIFDNDGNLYSVSGLGGVKYPLSDCNFGCGTAFELMPKAGGGWAFKDLHQFELDGGEGPVALTFGPSGNLYGTTAGGGKAAVGTVFELMPTASGGWAEKILHNFGLYPADGQSPNGGVIFDAEGNLYGTRGAYFGTVFELMPRAKGEWIEKILFAFNQKDGMSPSGSLTFDTAGNLYGTTVSGGPGPCHYGDDGCGTVFELTPQAGGRWSETVLYNFGGGTDGETPYGSLVFDGAGNLYGTTALGGTGGCAFYACGTVFKLSPNPSGVWSKKVLHNFNDDGEDGIRPQAGLIFDSTGNLYGTTPNGGANGVGTVFEITP